MTKYLLLLIIIPLLSGCRVKRSLSVNTNTQTENVEQKNVQEHEVYNRDSSGESVTEMVQIREAEAETETTTKTIEYDSSKPIIPETGKPPVLRETESTTRARKKLNEGTTGKQEESISVTDQKDRTEIDQSSATTKQQIKATAEKKEKKSGSRSWLLFITVGIGLFYIINKRFSLFR